MRLQFTINSHLLSMVMAILDGRDPHRQGDTGQLRRHAIAYVWRACRFSPIGLTRAMSGRVVDAIIEGDYDDHGLDCTVIHVTV